MHILRRVFLGFALGLAFSSLAAAKPKSIAKSIMKPDLVWAEAQLQKQKLPKSFVQMLKSSYDRKSFERVLTLNLLGFMSPPSHMKLVTDQATANSRDFVIEHIQAFTQAENQYGVPPEVISSLLWIETRHGALTGSFHVPSVYLHLLQADRPENRAQLLKLALVKNTEAKFTKKELVTRIKERSKRRSDWAMEQLVALNQIHARKMKDLSQLKGSFAGAFGLPQFIPSSYQVWAATSKAHAAPNLFDRDDAIMSVANYLNVHGWKTADASTHIPALMKYNQSRDYAESILEIARRVKGPEDKPANARGLASDIFESPGPKKKK